MVLQHHSIYSIGLGPLKGAAETKSLLLLLLPPRLRGARGGLAGYDEQLLGTCNVHAC